jgi:uncharacterized protein
MSEQNVELIRATFEPLEGQNLVEMMNSFESPESRAMLEAVYSPDIEITWNANAPDRGPYHGIDGLIRAYREWLASFEEFYVEPADFIDAGDHVIVPMVQRGKGLASGVLTEGEFTHIYSIEDGRIARIREYETLEEAKREAGVLLD